MTTPELEEVTELASQQPLFRELVQHAFAARLGAVHPEYDFHRGWNGGWRCRATLPGKVPLDFALLRATDGALLALPVPMPNGWRRRGVRDSLERAWTVNDALEPVLVVPDDNNGAT